MREKTERPEGVKRTPRGWLASADRIFERHRRADGGSVDVRAMSHASNPYGDGTASLQILRCAPGWFAVLSTGSLFS